jgi:hypothetical protein
MKRLVLATISLLFSLSTLADDSIVFTVPVNLDNVQYEDKSPVPNRVNEPNVMVGCWIASAMGVEKGVSKALIKTSNGSFNGQMQISVLPKNPNVPFQKGDKWLCSINVNSGGWANTFSNYLTLANKPAKGQPLRMVVGGYL